MKTLIEIDKYPEINDIVFSKARSKILLHHIIGFKTKKYWGVAYNYVLTVNENGHSSECEYESFVKSFCYYGHSEVDFKSLFEAQDVATCK